MRHWKGLSATFVAMSTVAGVGWGAAEYMDRYVEKPIFADAIVVVRTQAQFVLDQQVESLVVQIDRLRRKPRKTEAETEQLRYLERQLEITKKIRQGK